MSAPRSRRAISDLSDGVTARQLQWSKLTKLQARLKEDLERPRIKVSEAANDLVEYIEAAEADQLVVRTHRPDDFPTSKKVSIGSLLRCG